MPAAHEEDYVPRSLRSHARGVKVAVVCVGGGFLPVGSGNVGKTGWACVHRPAACPCPVPSAFKLPPFLAAEPLPAETPLTGGGRSCTLTRAGALAAGMAFELLGPRLLV